MRKTGSKTFRPGFLRLHILPILVWLAVLGVVVTLFYHRSERFEVLGLAQGQIRQITATCTGRLKSVPVELFDEVKQGDTVAVIDTVLDNENLQAELNVISAEIQHLMAELVPTQERLVTEEVERETDTTARQRRFTVDAENAKLRVLELKTLLETDRIMLQDLAVEVKIAQQLLNQNAIAPYELQKVEVQYDILAKKIEENEHLQAETEQNLRQAQQRRDEFAQYLPQHPSTDDFLNVIHKAIKVQEQLIEQVLARREVLILKSPLSNGIVSMIQRRAGETVLPGEPILTITEIKPTEIVAYASEKQIGRIKENMTVELIKTSEPAQIAVSQVVHLGHVMELMPQRLWQNPNVAQWGRPMLIKVPPGFGLILGETVGIRGL